MRNRGSYRCLIFSVLLLSILLTGCTRLQEPVISDVSVTGCDIKGLTAADIHISLSVNNPNRKSLSAESVTGEVFLNGASIATVSLANAPLTAPAQSMSKLEGCFSVKITDPLSMLAAGLSLRDLDLSHLTADADIFIKIGDSPKKIRIREFPLSRLSSYLNL